MLRKTISLMAVFGVFAHAMGQQKDSTVKVVTDTATKTAPAADSAKPSPPAGITGSVDAYYRTNFSGPKSGNNNHTSFTNSNNSFEIGMADVRIDHSFGKVSAAAEIGFGRRAEENSYNDNNNLLLSAIIQAYVSYQVSSKIKFTMGKWSTHVGYEVVDAFANRNYSMDYMFSYGPFFHTGLKADVTLSSTTAFMVGVADPTDFSTTTSSVKVFLAQFSTGTKNGKLKAFLNYQGYGGAAMDSAISTYTLYKSLSQFDLVINGTISSKFGIGLNGTVQTVNSSTLNKTASWWGAALYLNYDPTTAFGLTLRGEYFGDKDGVKINPIDMGTNTAETPGLNVFDLTLSGNYRVGTNLTIIPEIRLDNGSKAFFYKSDGSTSNSTVSALLAVVYHF